MDSLKAVLAFIPWCLLVHQLSKGSCPRSNKQEAEAAGKSTEKRRARQWAPQRMQITSDVFQIPSGVRRQGRNR